MANDVTRSVGKVMKIVPGDPNKIIFVFEDWHRSRLDQLQNAVMLNRLYTRYRLRHVGLEGFTADKGTLNLTWAHRSASYQPDQKMTGREDVIVQTLEDGEISSAEMLGLIYADVVVHGIDDPQLYAVEESQNAMAAQNLYLAKIAYARMNKDQRATYQSLRDQKKDTDAFAFAVSTDKVVADIWWRYTSGMVVGISAEDQLAILYEIQQEADKAGFKPSPAEQAAMNELIEYVRVLSRRSDAMVANMLKVAAANPGAPLALAGLGSDHVKRVEELLTQAGVSVVLVRTATRAAQTVDGLLKGDQYKSGLLSDEALNRKYQGRSVAPSGTLGALLGGGRKPSPVADKQWYKQMERIQEYLQALAWAAVLLNQQTGANPAEVSQTLIATSGKWASLLNEVGIASATITGINVSGFTPTVQVTVVMQGGQTFTIEVQVNPEKYNPSQPTGGSQSTVGGEIEKTSSDWAANSVPPAPPPGDPHPITPSVQVTSPTSGVSTTPPQTDWWQMKADQTGIWKIDSDGNKITMNFDGTTVVETKDGTKITEYTAGPLAGTKITEYTSGALAGMKVTETPSPSGGTIKVTEYTSGPNIGQKVTVSPDGKIVTEIPGPKGPTVVIEYPESQWEAAKKVTVTHYPWGDSTTTEIPGQPTVTVHADGRIETVEGSKTTIKFPDGRWESSDPQAHISESYDPKTGEKTTFTDKGVTITDSQGKVWPAHIIEPGEQFAQIAAKYGVTVEDLKKANPGLSEQDIVAPRVGTLLKIPTK